jgi:hypothetical protein
MSFLLLLLTSLSFGIRYEGHVDEKRPDEAFLREWTIPEEDRAKYTSQPWDGEYRWFRSPNVVCLEQYRRRSRRHKA